MIEMKNSGVDWIGEIPAHWEVKRLKSIFSECKDLSSTGDEDLLSVSEYYGVARRLDIKEDDEFDSRADSLEGYKICKKNDLVINIMLAWKRGLGFSDYDGIVSPAYAVYRGKNIVPHYYHYLLRTDRYIAEFKRNSKGIIDSRLRLYSDRFFNIKTIVPPLAEQQAIADYLDKKTAEIDEQITALEKKSDAYQRLKRSLISEVVTRGLNPTAELKDSGIEWIGEIPAHWEVKRLKDISYLYGGLTGKAGEDFTPEQEKGMKPYIPFTNVLNNYVINPQKMNYVYISEGEVQNRVKRNDLIFLMSSEDYESIAKSAVVLDELGEVYLNSFCRGLRFTDKRIEPKFVNYLLSATPCRDALRFEAKGFTRINIKIEKIASQFIFYPPLAEQQAIADYLDKKTAEIDSNISAISSKIDAYKRFKQSLIDEVVTGKRRIEKA